MFSALKAFLIALPELIDLAKKAVNGIIELIQIKKENALKERELIASQKALVSGDTSDLEAIFRGQKKKESKDN